MSGISELAVQYQCFEPTGETQTAGRTALLHKAGCRSESNLQCEDQDQVDNDVPRTPAVE